jgi:hypothetical protein
VPDPVTTELARIAAEELTPEVSAFAAAVVGSPSLELGELVAEQIRAWRFKRAIKIAGKARQQMADAGLDPRSVPLRTLAPLLDGATVTEDNDVMEDRWASLLANAAGGLHEVPPSFARILAELEPVEARVLDHVYNVMMSIAPEIRRHDLGMMRGGVAEELGLPGEAIEFHVDNLIRLRLVREPTGSIGGTGDTVTLSEFGRRFVRACRPPSQPDPPVRFTNAAEIRRQAALNRERWSTSS